jgi:predicted small secreted protein
VIKSRAVVVVVVVVAIVMAAAEKGQRLWQLVDTRRLRIQETAGSWVHLRPTRYREDRSLPTGTTETW